MTGAAVRLRVRAALERTGGQRLSLVAAAGPLPVATHGTNLFLRLMWLRVPVRLFTDVAAAPAWALEQPHG